MSGHSHWAGIKRKKGANDAKRGQVFSKLARNITNAARVGGADPDANLKLKYAIDKARETNMPKDNIDRAIKKGTGDLGGESYEEIVYEGYGPGGVAILLETLTDNRNRTAPELRRIFDHSGGNLGSTGCVAWMFEQKGLFTVDVNSIEEDDLMEICLDAGADDVSTADGVFEILSAPADFTSVESFLKEKGIELQLAILSFIPKSTIKLEDDVARRVVRLMENLDDQDDVQNVYANFDISAELAEQLAADNA